MREILDEIELVIDLADLTDSTIEFAMDLVDRRDVAEFIDCWSQLLCLGYGPWSNLGHFQFGIYQILMMSYCCDRQLHLAADERNR